LPEVEVVLFLNDTQVPGQLGADDGRERRGPVLVALARADDDLIPPEIDILHSEPSALQEAQARAIQQGHEAGSAAELTENGPHLLAGEHDWSSHWPPGPPNVVEPGHLLLENLAMRKSRALSAWFWVDAATFPSTASELGYRVSSEAPIAKG
jgi:hypothetical protein